MNTLKAAQTLFLVISAGTGLFISLKPALAIKIQKRFYEKFNWHVEPIPEKKEVRDARIMGIFLFALAMATTLFVPQH